MAIEKLKRISLPKYSDFRLGLMQNKAVCSLP